MRYAHQVLNKALNDGVRDGRFARNVVRHATVMPRGELLGLRWEDVDLDAGTTQVRRALAQIRDRVLLKYSKTRKPRTLTIDATTARLLRQRATSQDDHHRRAGDGGGTSGAWCSPNPTGRR